MSMSSEERRKRVHRAVQAQKHGGKTGAYRNNSYDDTGAQGQLGAGSDESEHLTASYRRPAGSSMQGGTKGTSHKRRIHADSSQKGSGVKRGRKYRKKRRIERYLRIGALAAGLLLAVVLCVFAVRGVAGLVTKRKAAASEAASEAQTEAETSVPETTAAPVAETLSAAEKLAMQYDYDGAIALLNENAAIAETDEAKAAIASYEEIKSTLVRQDISTVTHVFFHILVVDTENAFDKSKWGSQADGYNSLMTTITEFNRMLEEMYQNGYVLVRIHDLASMQEQEDGSVKMVANDIMLPPGKKAMVMSEDDVCYYEYMEGAGFADRMILGDDGRPTCVYTDPDGAEHIGEYDLVPILNRFVDEHPDFSYKGAKAIIAFTGYNGVLGYRTDETYDPSSDMYDSEKWANPDIEADRETARQVLKALKEDGYELASHSWGHRDMGADTVEHMKKDTDRWDRNVNQLLMDGECDILIYPKGADVGDWRQSSYSHETNEKFDYLWQKGFRYFCNVDNNQYWVQKGDDFLRQGRRALDGYNMWLDIAEGYNRLNDLFSDVNEIFDPARPTPVPSY